MRICGTCSKSRVWLPPPPPTRLGPGGMLCRRQHASLLQQARSAIARGTSERTYSGSGHPAGTDERKQCTTDMPCSARPTTPAVRCRSTDVRQRESGKHPARDLIAIYELDDSVCPNKLQAAELRHKQRDRIVALLPAPGRWCCTAHSQAPGRRCRRSAARCPTRT